MSRWLPGVRTFFLSMIVHVTALHTLGLMHRWPTFSDDYAALLILINVFCVFTSNYLFCSEILWTFCLKFHVQCRPFIFIVMSAKIKAFRQFCVISLEPSSFQRYRITWAFHQYKYCYRFINTWKGASIYSLICYSEGVDLGSVLILTGVTLLNN